MFPRFCLMLALLAALSSLTFLPVQTAHPVAVSQPNSAPSVDSPELQAMKSDAQKMRVTLNQMRTNLAFVDTSQSPLKHQFELEIDMWQMQLDQMDKRIEKSEPGSGDKK
jgi:hypothetical protein